MVVASAAPPDEDAAPAPRLTGARPPAAIGVAIVAAPTRQRCRTHSPRQHVRHAGGRRVPARLHHQRAVLRHRVAVGHRLRRRSRRPRAPRHPIDRRSARALRGGSRCGWCAPRCLRRGWASTWTRLVTEAIAEHRGADSQGVAGADARGGLQDSAVGIGRSQLPRAQPGAAARAHRAGPEVAGRCGVGRARAARSLSAAVPVGAAGADERRARRRAAGAARPAPAADPGTPATIRAAIGWRSACCRFRERISSGCGSSCRRCRGSPTRTCRREWLAGCRAGQPSPTLSPGSRSSATRRTWSRTGNRRATTGRRRQPTTPTITPATPRTTRRLTNARAGAAADAGVGDVDEAIRQPRRQPEKELRYITRGPRRQDPSGAHRELSDSGSEI